MERTLDAILTFFFKYPPRLYQRGDLSLAPTFPPPLIALVLSVALLALVLVHDGQAGDREALRAPPARPGIICCGSLAHGASIQGVTCRVTTVRDTGYDERSLGVPGCYTGGNANSVGAADPFHCA